ncbi:class II aldolase/adducin family protein [Oscillochloris sp. ZM17-4]|uniref:class II aldolase/adducin family protein n=1 Tax=Oscillochloris sp. ZM17-4 TaxID=2866714 RepID=UPI001C733602|nr:class II aldolase/adducin family protein [Oscillochloris sp. ZM17-4]MBX0329270.1 class II aldolase/adducin family protein [Oscillochloris sp. ZM17-4]
MPLDQPYPDLDEFLSAIGEAGQRLAHINASEGGAGNISIFIGWPLEVRRRFPLAEPFALPSPAPSLAGGLVIVTGSGRRLRDIHMRPEANLGVVAIGPDGQSATLYSAPSRLFQRVTSEFNSHLAVHQDEVARTGTNFQALIHAQPPHLVYLSHIPAYRDQAYFNRQIMRWEPETIVNLPKGVGVLPYCLPGSSAMMEANVAGLRAHNVVLWGKHGVMARSDRSMRSCGPSTWIRRWRRGGGRLCHPLHFFVVGSGSEAARPHNSRHGGVAPE